MGEKSEFIRARVKTARNVQSARFPGTDGGGILCNADMRVGEVRKYCKLQE